MSFLTKEKLAIREAIHAMKWLDQHFKGWGLEKECAILENLCSNYKEKEIQSNHNYLDLQYQLDSAESEIERLREEIKILKMGEKVANELILRGRAAEERIEELENEIEWLRAENAWLKSDREFQSEEQAARIKELEDAHKRAGAKYAKIIRELRSSVYANIPGLDVGKIGPDAEELRHCTSCGKSIEEIKGNLCKGDYFIGSIFIDPGQEGSRYDPPIEASYYFSCCDCSRSWQITEERIGLLEYCLETLLDAPDIEESPGPRHSIEMLRTMLAEAEQCE